LKHSTPHLGAKLLSVAFCFCLATLPLRADGTRAAAPALDQLASPAGTNAPCLKPGPDDGRIAFWTARLLERTHYSHHPFDSTISSEFLDGYLEALDPRHTHFLQSDLDEFEQYRTNLNRLTLTYEEAEPAFEIYCRFLERLKQRVAYVDDLLKHETFTFTNDDRFTVDRRHLPYPRDLAEARRLWRQQLRYEYLQEKLNREDPTKPKSNSARAKDGKTMDQQIVATLVHRYQRILRVFRDWNHEDVLGIYLTALAHVYDPHSDYFNAEQMANFRIMMNLELKGIGAELVMDDDGYCKIQKVLPNGPAAKSKKIHKDDRIVAVAQGNQPPVNVVDMSLNKTVQLIRGPKGTEVRLTLIPAGADDSVRTNVSLIRDEIPLDDQAAKGEIIEMPDGKGHTVRLGIIDLPSFYTAMPLGGGSSRAADEEDEAQMHSTSADVAKLLAKFKSENVSGVILDLRRNGGGSLEEAIRVTGLFIKDGPVVQVKTFDGSRRVEEDPDPAVAYDGPLIVLTSRLSASASEIVAGALQDYGRALIVGDTSTHGKGTVQNLNPLAAFMRMSASDTNDPGALKVTIRKFYRPSGASTQKKGVLPDIVLPSVLSYIDDLGESSLDHALAWDTIPSTKYDKLNLVQPYLAELLRRSNERTSTNRDFVYLRQDIDEYRKQEADKTLSLNEKKRLEEVDDNEARIKARNQERQARAPLDETVYDITLKDAVRPGLPPPESITNSFAAKSVGGAHGAGGTNALASADSPDADASGDASVGEDVWRQRAALEETENILLDYIGLLPKDPLWTRNQ
jgi:carboxyl-terminal processing protease